MKESRGTRVFWGKLEVIRSGRGFSTFPIKRFAKQKRILDREGGSVGLEKPRFD